VTGQHRHRHRPGPTLRLDTTIEGWGRLSGHQRGPTPGHQRGLSHGHGQLPEPAVRLSPQRALRKPQMGLPDPWYSLVWIFSTRRPPVESGLRIAGVHRRNLLIFHGRPLLAYWTPSPCAELSSARTTTGPPPRPSGLGSATDLPTSGLAARWEGDRGMVPTFTS